MSDAFISYSRRDSEFADRLCSELEARGKDVWIDRDDIPPASKFERDLREGVEQSDALVFVISPDSARSTYCRKEIEHADEVGKRIVPLLLRETESNELLQAVKEANWISFTPDLDFKQQVERLVTAIETDVDWVRGHTRWGAQAAEWKRQDSDSSFLLRGTELGEAERWLSTAPGKQPEPSALHFDYIRRGREAATRRQRVLIGGVLTALVVAIGLAIFALFQRVEALDQKDTALSRQLASSAALNLTTDPELSLLLARQALRKRHTTEAEDALRQGVALSHVRVTLGPHRDVLSGGAVFSPSGELIATGPADGTVRLWDQTGRLRRTLRHQKSRGPSDGRDVTETLAFADRGRLVMAETASDVRIWDVASGRLVRRIKLGNPGSVLSPRGDFISIPKAGFVSTRNQIWRPRDKKPLAEVAGQALAFDTSGDRLMVRDSSGETVSVMDRKTGRRIAKLQGRFPDVSLNGASFSPTGNRILTWGRNPALWSARSGRLEHRLPGHGPGFGMLESVESAEFSPDGRRVVTAGIDGLAMVWEVEAGKRISVLRANTGPISCASFTPDGRYVVTATGDGPIKIWTVEGLLVTSLLGHDQGSCAIFSPDGVSVLSAGTDRTARLWDARTKRQPIALDSYRGGRQETLGFSTDGSKVVTTSADGKAEVWGARTGRLLFVVGKKVRSTAMSSDDRWLLTVEGPKAELWDARNGRHIADLPGRGAKFTPDGRSVVTAGPYRGSLKQTATVRLWKLNRETGKPGPPSLKSPPVEDPDSTKDVSSSLLGAAISPDGQTMLSIEGTPTLWRFKTGQVVKRLEGHVGAVIEAEFSSDGRLALTAGYDQSVRIWDGQTGDPVAELAHSLEEIRQARFSPAGRRVVIATTTATDVWDVAGRQLVRRLRGNVAPTVTADVSTEFSPHGPFVLTAIEDRSRIWDIATGRSLVSFPGESGIARFSPDGRAVGIINASGTAEIYSCDFCRPLDDVLELADRRSTRALTAEERRAYLE